MSLSEQKLVKAVRNNDLKNVLVLCRAAELGNDLLLIHHYENNILKRKRSCDALFV